MDLLIRWLHVLSVVTWLGGMVFLGLVLVPVNRRLGANPDRIELVRLAAVRFRTVAWWALTILVLTGIGNTLIHWPTVSRSPFRHILAGKLILVVGILVLSVIHDFFIGPKLADAQAVQVQKGGRPEESITALARQVSWLARTNLLLGVITVLLALSLRG